MKITCLIFFLFFSGQAIAQLSEDFSDGELANSPTWVGDTVDFTVNSSAQLQLDAAAAGVSSISTPISPNMFTALEWRISITQNFSPSSGNFTRVYLCSDKQDLTGSVNGYYLQFGESLSADAVELFRQDGTSIVSICRATDGAIASSFSISVKVTRDEIGLWSLWIDYSGGTNYVLESYGAEASYTSTSYFGIFCQYTSGNTSKFIFDDLYVGSPILDTTAPQAIALEIQSSSEIEIEFSEALDQASAVNTANYFLDGGIGNPINASLNSSEPKKVILSFSTTFISAYTHTLSLYNISDVALNAILAGSSLQFTYYPPIYSNPNDIIFTEIMFEPSSSSALPDFEFVEIYNRTANAIPLKNWTLTDGSTTAVFPEVYLLPKSYMILCNTAAESVFASYGISLGLSSFPVLNNDVGDHVQLFDNSNVLIEDLIFSNKTYRDGNKDDGGYSLERIDTSYLCLDALNWKASSSSLGGTPGHASSIGGIYYDFQKPFVMRAFLEDSIHLRVLFSERMNAGNVLNPLMYSIELPNLSPVYPDSVLSTSNPLEYSLKLPFSVQHGICRLSINFGLKDCPGNDLDNAQIIRFAFPSQVDSDDVVINEILFNPQIGGSDFVEAYNCSDKVLDIHNWRIAEASFNDIATVQESKSISPTPYLFFPGEYVVLSSNTSDVLQRYDTPGIKVFTECVDFPDFNSADGAVILYDSLGNVLDFVNYSEDMHFPLLTDKKGVSLERLSPKISSDISSNWHSAASSSGFATPGDKNSIGWTDSESTDGFSIDPLVFSPDNDGYNDLLYVRLKQSGELEMGKVLVFDIGGRKVKELARQVILGDEYAVIWDGTKDNGELAAIGTYIIFAELFNLNGQVKKKKLSCALTLK